MCHTHDLIIAGRPEFIAQITQIGMPYKDLLIIMGVGIAAERMCPAAVMTARFRKVRRTASFGAPDL